LSVFHDTDAKNLSQPHPHGAQHFERRWSVRYVGYRQFAPARERPREAGEPQGKISARLSCRDSPCPPRPVSDGLCIPANDVWMEFRLYRGLFGCIRTAGALECFKGRMPFTTYKAPSQHESSIQRWSRRIRLGGGRPH
jgi:hypothetical protein